MVKDFNIHYEPDSIIIVIDCKNTQSDKLAMQFRTTIKLKEAKYTIDIQDKILLIGSCFSEHMGTRLNDLKWNICQNPHGIVFNPASIHNSINEIVIEKQYSSDDIFQYNELWYSWQHHGSFSHLNPKQLLSQINTSITIANQFIKTANVCIITLGSAWVYRHIKQNKIVANCHKVPQQEFTKSLLSVKEINDLLVDSISQLRKLNPSIKVLLTLSPVRYLKDGFTENALSKAHLLTAIHEIVKMEALTEYFPSYEIFIDDLRDYRFNTIDLVHPNEQAVDYIWEKFVEFIITYDTKPIIKEISNWRKQLDHRPFHIETEEYKVFKKLLLKKTEELQERFPFLDFSKELKEIKS